MSPKVCNVAGLVVSHASVWRWWNFQKVEPQELNHGHTFCKVDIMLPIPAYVFLTSWVSQNKSLCPATLPYSQPWLCLVRSQMVLNHKPAQRSPLLQVFHLSIKSCCRYYCLLDITNDIWDVKQYSSFYVV